MTNNLMIHKSGDFNLKISFFPTWQQQEASKNRNWQQNMLLLAKHIFLKKKNFENIIRSYRTLSKLL